MSVSCFLYGLVSFSMGLVVLLRGRRNSQIALGSQFYWLSAFAFFSSIYAWGRMFQRANPAFSPVHETASLLIPFALAAAGVVLVRFGIGLIAEAGPMPAWMHLLPVVLLVPAMLLVAYAIIVIISAADLVASAEQWSRYLLLFPGCVFAALGFIRQWRRLKQAGTVAAPGVLLFAAIAWLVNAVVTGAITETVGLNSQMIARFSGQPIEFWRLITMTAVAALVMRSMGVFEIEREQEITRLNAARHEAQKMALTIHTKSRQESEMWLNALVGIGRRVANMDEADTVLADVVMLARSLVNGDAAGIALYETGSQLQARVQATAEGVSVFRAPGVVNPVIRRAAQTGSPLRFPEDVPTSAFYWQQNGGSVQATSAAVVPLRLNQTTIGALWTARRNGSAFTCADLIGLGYLANQVVITLEHASMAARLQSLAVIEERSRIAREMHDSLAQILGYLGLETQTLEALVHQNDTEALLAELKSARAAIKSAQADVRENILSLRTTLAGDIDLSDALSAYVQEFGIQMAIQAETVNNVGSALALSPLAETQCVRIVQEALTNVRKHAQANHVCVEMNAHSGWFEIRVIDDGIGLPRHTPSNRHFGLQTMRERAESVGGSLTVVSPPNQGTTVTLRLPLLS
jgi:signal transduction histidine kinase